jgi:hypothetical protein
MTKSLQVAFIVVHVMRCVHGREIPASILSSWLTVLAGKLVEVLVLFDQPKKIYRQVYCTVICGVVWRCDNLLIRVYRGVGELSVQICSCCTIKKGGRAMGFALNYSLWRRDVVPPDYKPLYTLLDVALWGYRSE